MHLLELFLELYKEEYDLNLQEGLIKTTNIGKTVNLLQKHFPNLKIKRTSKDQNTFRVEINSPTQVLLEEFLKKADTLGWFPSHCYYEDVNSRFENVKYTQKILGIVETLKTLEITFEAKFDDEVVDKIPEVLYHLTPSQNTSKIFKVGLVPKSRSKKAFHPERVYLGRTLEDVKGLAAKMKQATGIDSWDILEVHTDLIPGSYFRLYKDPNYLNKGYYTLNNIPPQAIEKIQTINL